LATTRATTGVKNMMPPRWRPQRPAEETFDHDKHKRRDEKGGRAQADDFDQHLDALRRFQCRFDSYLSWLSVVIINVHGVTCERPTQLQHEIKLAR